MVSQPSQQMRYEWMCWRGEKWGRGWWIANYGFWRNVFNSASVKPSTCLTTSTPLSSLATIVGLTPCASLMRTFMCGWAALISGYALVTKDFKVEAVWGRRNLSSLTAAEMATILCVVCAVLGDVALLSSVRLSGEWAVLQLQLLKSEEWRVKNSWVG